MKELKIFSWLFFVSPILLFECGETKDDDAITEDTQVIKIDACQLITPSDLSAIAGAELQPLETTNLEGNDFYHYVSLCGFYQGDMIVTIRLGQRKTVVDPVKRRDSAIQMQEEEANVFSTQAIDISGLPGLYYEEKDTDINLTMNVIMFYAGQFETTLICTQDITKSQMIKISEKIAASVVAKSK